MLAFIQPRYVYPDQYLPLTQLTNGRGHVKVGHTSFFLDSSIIQTRGDKNPATLRYIAVCRLPPTLSLRQISAILRLRFVWLFSFCIFFCMLSLCRENITCVLGPCMCVKAKPPMYLIYNFELNMFKSPADFVVQTNQCHITTPRFVCFFTFLHVVAGQEKSHMCPWPWTCVTAKNLMYLISNLESHMFKGR